MSFHSQHHSFDIHLASLYGIEEAILIHHFQHWIRVNRKRGKNLHEGKCWMYQSRADISAHFPYLNEQAIRYCIERLEALDVLVSSNFNRARFDKTRWYAFVDEKLFGVDQESIDKMEENSKNSYESGKPLWIAENRRREAVNRQPIPDTIKEDAKEEDISKSSGPEKSADEKAYIKKGRKSDPPSAEAQALSEFFFSHIKSKKDDFMPKGRDKWADDFDKMLRIDRRHPERIKDVIKCLDLKALSFVQCAKKLRDQFEALEMRYMAQLEKSKVDNNRQFFLKSKNQYPKEFKNISFTSYEVTDIEKNIKVPFDLSYRDFAEAIAKMIGGEIHES